VDGWYRDGDQLYKRPGTLMLKQRFDWLLYDPATHRDHLWALITGLAAVPFALAGLVAGPAVLRLYGRLAQALLGPSGRTGRHPVWRWLVSRAIAKGRVEATIGLALAGIPFLAMHVLAVVPGMVQPLSAVVPLSRRFVNRRRSLLLDWSGVSIAEPYLPKPPAPRPRPDGKYLFMRRLHDSPEMIVRFQVLGGMIRDAATWRDLLWLTLDPLVAIVLGAVPIALVVAGFLVLWTMPLMVGLAMVTAPVLLRVHGLWSRWLLAPTKSAVLAKRIEQLTETRTDATDAQAAELRRIERDLHDGAQARWVAMGLNLGAVERLIDQDPEMAKKLLESARNASAEALVELRELVRGIHPPVLAERGLGDAVRALALDSALDVRVTVDLPGRADAPIETALYFAVSELLANAAKHAEATRVTVDLRHTTGELRVVVTDDGRGGADPAGGSGLRGLRRRLATFDGTLALSSPPGGPTTAILEIPCALSSPRTSTSSETA
jgi:signal transduction histidine kinase